MIRYFADNNRRRESVFFVRNLEKYLVNATARMIRVTNGKAYFRIYIICAHYVQEFFENGMFFYLK